MLTVCSATPCSQTSLSDGLRSFSRSHKAFEITCNMGDKVLTSYGVHPSGMFLKTQASDSLCSYNLQSSKMSGYIDSINIALNPNEFSSLESRMQSDWSSMIGGRSEQYCVTNDFGKYIESPVVAVSEEQIMDLRDKLTESTDILMAQNAQGSALTLDHVVDTTVTSPDSFSSKNDYLSNVSSDFGKIFSNINESVSASLSKEGDTMNSYIDKIQSSISSVVKDANEAVDSIINKVFSSADRTKDFAGDRLISLSGDVKEGASAAGFLAIDLLRKTIVVIEDGIIKGAKFINYSYGSIKELLPPPVQQALLISEDRARGISVPVGAAFQQVFSAIEGVERTLGLDPSDPVVQFILLLGCSSAIWTVYWIITYSGYAGDLSPKIAFDLLSGKENVLLVDVRPEVLRERDGVPDLRRGARFRYSSVSLPEVDDSVQKLLKGGRDVYNSLTAVVIRNLKNASGNSKIIVMDADGTRSKGIARSLRNLGMKRSYRVQGGFNAWVKEGLRVKVLKPETAFNILNEEAEAILEELKPSPIQFLGVGLGSVLALYSLLEWETTLQFIGIFGLGQTIYRRIASYQDPEDLKKDVRLLLSPVQFGAQAVSWVAGKLETNGIALPTSPSSPDVQSRVLQAAAKHESQPSDAEEGGGDQNNPTPASEIPLADNVDLSEA